jgi:hypothetical protein
MPFDDMVEGLGETLEKVPIADHEGKPYTCRLWVRYAIRELHDFGWITLRRGCSPRELEAEANECGNDNY